MKNPTNLESMIREQLDQIREVSPRNPRAAARGRARFLAQAAAAREARRNKGWGLIFARPRFAMNMIVTLLVIASIFIGGGTTVKAAQDDLPNEPLYAIKTLSEDVGLRFQKDPEAKAERLLELAQTRVQEMDRMITSGQTPPDRVRVRLQQHLQESLELYSHMDDAALDRKLPQLYEQLQQQDHDLQRLQTHAAQNVQPLLENTRAMLQTQLHVVDSGLLDPEQFRDTVRNGLPYGRTPPALASSTPSTLPDEPDGQATPQPGIPGNGNGESLNPNPAPGEPTAEVTSTPSGTGTDTWNNAGGNDQDKGKGKDKDKEKDNDKDPKDKKPK